MKRCSCSRHELRGKRALVSVTAPRQASRHSRLYCVSVYHAPQTFGPKTEFYQPRPTEVFFQNLSNERTEA